jgi:hypothetical protein
MTHQAPPQPSISSNETEFDRLLREANIPLNDAHHYRMVADWVRRYHRTKYVPLAILEKFNIREEEIV